MGYFLIYFVKLNDLNLLCFHRAGYNRMKYEKGFCITLFSPSDVTAFHIMKYGGGGVI